MKICSENLLHAWSFKKNPRIFYLLVSTCILIYRSVLLLNNQSSLFIITMSFGFFQLAIIILFHWVKKYISSNYFFVNVLSIIVHMFSICVDYQDELLFFKGVETVIIVYLNLLQIKNKILRFTMLCLIFFALFKKLHDFNTNIIEIFYVIFLILVLDCSVEGKNILNENKYGVHINLSELPKNIIVIL